MPQSIIYQKLKLSEQNHTVPTEQGLIYVINRLGAVYISSLPKQSVILPEFQTKGLVKFQTSNPCIDEHKTKPSPFQW